jgi:Fur family ferric uptake transcriptional regulator
MPRLTPLRLLIVNFLEKHHIAPVKELLIHLKQQRPSTNKTTVYRSLESMEKEGVVCRHSFSEKESVYELRAHHHDHLVCTECGKIDVTSCKTEDARYIGGFRVDHHHLTYMGLCEDCDKKKHLKKYMK